MNGMRVEQDGSECRVLGSDGRVLALFDAGSPATNRRHAEAWIDGTFCRDAYESDLADEHGWTGQHVLTGLRDKR